MSAFRKKEIHYQTVGEVLREARLNRNASVGEAARNTGIRPEYLTALEDNAFERLPAGVYGRRFIEEYARFLGLRPRALGEQYEAQNRPESRGSDTLFGTKRIRTRDLILLPRWVRAAILVLIITGSLLYLGIRIQHSIAPPPLTVSWPPETFVTERTRVTVQGETIPETTVFVNGQPVVTDDAGRFSRDVTMVAGVNTVTVRAQKRYGRDAEVVRKILVK